MKVKYYKNDDLLVMKLADRPFKVAEKVGSFIIHYDAKKNPVLLEILNASKFLSETRKIRVAVAGFRQRAQDLTNVSP